MHPGLDAGALGAEGRKPRTPGGSCHVRQTKPFLGRLRGMTVPQAFLVGRDHPSLEAREPSIRRGVAAGLFVMRLRSVEMRTSYRLFRKQAPEGLN